MKHVGYYVHATNVFSFIKRATMLTELRIHGQLEFFDGDRDYWVYPISADVVRDAIDDAGLTSLPKLQLLSTECQIACSLLPCCASILSLTLYGSWYADLVEAITATASFPNLRVLEIPSYRAQSPMVKGMMIPLNL